MPIDYKKYPPGGKGGIPGGGGGGGGAGTGDGGSGGRGEMQIWGVI